MTYDMMKIMKILKIIGMLNENKKALLANKRDVESVDSVIRHLDLTLNNLKITL